VILLLEKQVLQKQNIHRSADGRYTTQEADYIFIYIKLYALTLHVPIVLPPCIYQSHPAKRSQYMDSVPVSTLVLKISALFRHY
jgi:hypothetical protein